MTNHEPNKRMDFFAALAEAAAIPEFVSNYDRLSGNNFGRVLSARGIEKMVDEASGFSNEETAKFAAFFYEFVWSRLPTTPEANRK